jgi:hypothetical protein
MPRDNTYKFIKKFHTNRDNYIQVKNMASMGTDQCRAEIKNFLGGNLSEADIDEIYYLLKRGTVEVTLKELDEFYTSSNVAPAHNTSDPPLTWST